MIKTRFASGFAPGSAPASAGLLRTAGIVRLCLFSVTASLLSLLFLGGGAGCKVESTPMNVKKDMTMVGVDMAPDTCAEKCEDPTNKCCNGEPCIDVKTNPKNCGDCNHVCATRELCSNGLCVCRGGGHDDVCPKDALCCSDGCHNIQTDPNNCGGCGLVCKNGETCQDGSCKCGPAGTHCSTGQVCCSSGCTDMQNDPKNCGMCGRVCPKGMCVNGLCDGECPTACTPFISKCCNSVCVDLANDPLNCGDCGKDCSKISKWNPPTCKAFICLGVQPDMGTPMDMSTTD